MQGASPDSFFASWLTSYVTAAVRITTFGSGYAPSILISICMAFTPFFDCIIEKVFPLRNRFSTVGRFRTVSGKKSRDGKSRPCLRI